MQTATISSGSLALRVLVVAAVAVGFFSVSRDSVYQATWITGQAHFLMAYFYQYKAGKINKAYIARYVLVFAVVFGVYALFEPNGWPNFLVLSYFVIHFLYDERFLMSESRSFEGWVRLSPIIIVCLSYSFAIFGIHIGEQAKILSLAILCGYAAVRVVKMQPITKQDVYFLCVYAACYFFTYSKNVISTPVAVNFIILLHFGNWYLNYLIKFSGDYNRFKIFSCEVIGINVLMLLLFFAYIATDGIASSALKYWFRDDYFCLWGIMHYFVTFRFSDLKNWMPDVVVNGRVRYSA